MIIFRNYNSPLGFTGDFLLVKKFLQRLEHCDGKLDSFDAVRWEWVLSLPYFEKSSINKIGIWQDNDKIVGLVPYETKPGEAFFCVDDKYDFLKNEMLEYAIQNLSVDNKLRVNIPDTDLQLQDLARTKGFSPSKDTEELSVFNIDNDITYPLEKGYSIVSLQEEYDIKKYGRLIYRGFNHGDNPPDTEEEYQKRKYSLAGPGNNLELKIAVRSPEGEFVSYCGMWYIPGSENAHVEPVATDPDFRKRGFGKAAVLEGIKRCAAMGAKRAYVGSSLEFYYKIGFKPAASFTYWENKQ